MKLKENSSHLKKTDENLLLKSMKNTYKASSFGKLLDAIEDKENHFTKPPKAQKISNVCFKDCDILNLERIGIKKSRSRQHNNLNKKSNTIQVSPKKEGKEEGLDYQKNALKRKSSHHADFSKYSGKNTKLKQAFSNPKICGSLKSLYSSNKESEIAKKLKSSITDHTESISIIKRSIMDTSNSWIDEQPEIEFTEDKMNLKRFQKIKLYKSKIEKALTRKTLDENTRKSVLSFKDSKGSNKKSKISLLNPWKTNDGPVGLIQGKIVKTEPISRNSAWELYKKSDYDKKLDLLAKNLIQKLKPEEEEKNENIQKIVEDKPLNKSKKIGLKNPLKTKIKKGDIDVQIVERPNIIPKAKIKQSKPNKIKKPKSPLLGGKILQPSEINKTKNLGKKLSIDKVKIKRKNEHEKITEENIAKAVTEIPQWKSDVLNNSDANFAINQFESIYSSQEGEMKTEAGCTQDSRPPTCKGSKKIKKKNLRRNDERAINLNLKHSQNSSKRKRKKSSRSKKRSSSTRKYEEGTKSLSKRRLNGSKSSFWLQEGVQANSTRNKLVSKQAHNQSKASISIHNVSKRVRSKKKVRLNKVKSSRLLIKKEKIRNSSKNKRKSKSPRQIDDKKFKTTEITKTFDPKSQQSPQVHLDKKDVTPVMISKAEFATNIPSSKDDFLSFIEKHEVMHQMSKEKRMNNKENSIASTNTGCTNSKISRPFSGDPKTQESKRKILPNGKNKTGVFRSRESSSANYKNKPERFLYNDNNTVTAAPTHIEEDKYLPDIEETLSKNSDTEYELSPDEGSVEKSLGKTNKNSTVGTNNNELSEIMNDRENHDSKVKNSQNKF